MTSKIDKLHLYYWLKDIYPDVVAEFKFLDNRRFRFDWYIPSKKCGIEYEGLFAKKSRHTSIKGFHGDLSSIYPRFYT